MGARTSAFYPASWHIQSFLIQQPKITARSSDFELIQKVHKGIAYLLS